MSKETGIRKKVTIRNNSASPFTLIDVIDTGQVVYYSARHTLATHYLNSSGANAAELAAVMGRSVSGIGTYVHQLTDEQSTLLRLERLSF